MADLDLHPDLLRTAEERLMRPENLVHDRMCMMTVEECRWLFDQARKGCEAAKRNAGTEAALLDLFHAIEIGVLQEEERFGSFDNTPAVRYGRSLRVVLKDLGLWREPKETP